MYPLGDRLWARKVEVTVCIASRGKITVPPRRDFRYLAWLSRSILILAAQLGGEPMVVNFSHADLKETCNWETQNFTFYQHIDGGDENVFQKFWLSIFLWRAIPAVQHSKLLTPARPISSKAV